MRHTLFLLIAALGLFGAALLSTAQSTKSDPSSARAEGGITVSQRIDQMVEREMGKLGINGASLAIVRNDAVVYSRGYGLADVKSKRAVTKETLFEAASLSKVAFAYYALREVDRGTIALDVPLARILSHPDIDDERAKRITPRMVLTHRTGFPNWRWENADDTLDIKEEPGTFFRYSGEGFEYLALALAHAHGTDKLGLEAFMRADLQDALGCDVGPWTYSRSMQDRLASGYVGDELQADWQIESPIVSASLFTTADDYGCLLAAVVSGKGLETSTFDKMVANQIELEPGHDFRLDFGLDAWGLGVAIKQTEFGTALSHGGVNEGFTAWFTVLSDQRAGYVILTNSQEAPKLNAAIEARLLALALEFE
ncbi:MAG: serine hydrolase domain-containing protein [Pseudomonadota bacterium]